MELAAIDITEMSCQYPQGLDVICTPYSGSLVMGACHEVEPQGASGGRVQKYSVS